MRSKARTRNSRRVEKEILWKVATATKARARNSTKVQRETRETREPSFQDFMELARVRGRERKQMGKGPLLPVPKATSHSTKCARMSEEPPEVAEQNSNKIPDAGAMTVGSKRRHEAVMSASDSEDGIGSYSFISDTGDSPPLFPCVATGLPGTHKWGDDWEADINYEEVDFSVPKPAWIKDTYHWSCTLLKMGKFAASPTTYHAFVVKVFNKSADECRYAKKMIGQFRKKLTSTPRTQGPDFCAFLMHCRVDAFLNAGYVYSNGADGGDWQGAACLSYGFWWFSFVQCSWNGCSVQNLWDFFNDGPDCMESVVRWFQLGALVQLFCINKYVDTDNSDDTGIINVHRYFRDICNCWEEMTSCADPHNGLRMRWIHIHLHCAGCWKLSWPSCMGTVGKRGYGSINSRWYGEHVLRSSSTWCGSWNLVTTMLFLGRALDLLQNGRIASGHWERYIFRCFLDFAWRCQESGDDVYGRELERMFLKSTCCMRCICKWIWTFWCNFVFPGCARWFFNNNKPNCFSAKLRFAFSRAACRFSTTLWRRRMFLEFVRSLWWVRSDLEMFLEMLVNSTTANSPQWSWTTVFWYDENPCDSAATLKTGQLKEDQHSTVHVAWQTRRFRRFSVWKRIECLCSESRCFWGTVLLKHSTWWGRPQRRVRERLVVVIRSCWIFASLASASCRTRWWLHLGPEHCCWSESFHPSETCTPGPAWALRHTLCFGFRSSHQVPEKHFSLLGSPRSEKRDGLPDLPTVGLDMHNIDVLLVHFPPGQRQRAERIREVSLFSELSLREFILCHLMVLFRDNLISTLIFHCGGTGRTNVNARCSMKLWSIRNIKKLGVVSVNNGLWIKNVFPIETVEHWRGVQIYFSRTQSKSEAGYTFSMCAWPIYMATAQGWHA